ncbi:MAG: hypothetical protein ABSE80_02210 [Halobacteriota archaeon]|jgi:hypothetical protein
MTQCTFCNYRDAGILEQQIATKQITQPQAADIIGCNKSTVSRHMSNCVPRRIRESMKPEPVEVADLNVVNALTTSHQTTLDILQDSLSDRDRKHALLALQTEIRQLDLMAKVTGQVNTAPQMNFMVNPELVRLKQVIIETLRPYPKARLALSDALDADAKESNDGGQ